MGIKYIYNTLILIKLIMAISNDDSNNTPQLVCVIGGDVTQTPQPQPQPNLTTSLTSTYYNNLIQSHNFRTTMTTPPLPTDEKTLLEPYIYLRQHPGKDIRSKLIEAFDVWLQVPPAKLDIIKEVVEMLHTASLLIDDIEDNSSLRRGVPVAHKIYGTPLTINCANYVYFLALQKVQQLGSAKAVEIYTEEMLNLHKGQGMEIFWRDTMTCPTVPDYLEMIKNKTGGLFRLAIKLMQEAAQSQDNYIPIVNILGIHFQVRDDYLNLQSDTFKENKGFAEDLTEGKFSFPIIHSIGVESNNNQLLNILKQRTEDYEIKSYAIQLMNKTNSFEYTREFLDKVEKEAREEIARLKGNPAVEKILDYLVGEYRK